MRTALLLLALTTITAAAAAERPRWAIALHGGAGAIPRDIPDDRRDAYLDSLAAARQVGVDVLKADGSAVDAVEAVVRVLEDDPLFNAGRGAVFNAAGRCQLDASVMDGRTLAGGGVAAVETLRHPVTAARRVMDRTPHVLLVGRGAEAFAADAGCETTAADYFFSDRRWASMERALRRSGRPVPKPPEGVTPGRPADDGERPGNTVGCVALDSAGHLAAATSTGGLTAKMPGRVGDSPLLGAGTYADDRGAAVSATGQGEQYIRHAVAFRLSEAVRGGAAVDEAARAVLEDVLNPGDGGLIALDRDGRMSLRETTGAMPRAWAADGGPSGATIWDTP